MRTLRFFLFVALPLIVTGLWAVPVSQATPLNTNSLPVPLTLLDETGHLAQNPGIGQMQAWKQELNDTHPGPLRAAQLHLWVGEWELAQNEQPGKALWHFRCVQKLLPGKTPMFDLAAYDSAISIYYQGAYQPATEAFRALLHDRTHRTAYSLRTCALWYRHAGACAAYHAQRASLGIPEPPRLDPRCGAAALAACLRSLSRPFDSKTVLNACRVTGEGSTLADVEKAARTLNVSEQAVTADDVGLRLLPKPLVAYVERDHFVAVVQADLKGVDYLCSDCGPWPGGLVHLTWKQWHALAPGLYLVVTPRGSAWATALASPSPGSLTPRAAVRLAYAGSLSRLTVIEKSLTLGSMAALRGHVFRPIRPLARCIVGPSSMHCLPYVKCSLDPPCNSGRSGSPTGGDPVNLETGEEEYQPDPDLTVYNPHGPSVVWKRLYNSLRPEGGDPSTGRTVAYQADDFGDGWSQPYNSFVLDTGATQRPQILAGNTNPSGFGPTGTDLPASGLTWDVVQLPGNTPIATSSSPSGWTVTYSSGAFSSVLAPSGATDAVNCEVRYNTGSGGSSLGIDVLGITSVPQGYYSVFAATGTDSAASGQAWDIVQGGTTIASQSQPSGWTAGIYSYGISITAPLSAAVGTSYEARFGGHSAFFSIVACRYFNTISGFKSLVLPDGARLSFTAPSIPTAANPKVLCTPQSGAAVIVEWDYDTSIPSSHYTITFPDRSQWVTGPTTHGTPTTGYDTVTYSLAQIRDRVGNAINLNYGAPATWASASGFPLLSSITDATTSAILLQVDRAIDGTGTITDVYQPSQRKVYYQYGSYPTTILGLNYPLVNWVSQVVSTGTSLGSAPMRWSLGYTPIATAIDQYLHTITVPSPTGVGNATATINYDSSRCLVTSLVDANGNTRSYSYDDGDATTTVSGTALPTPYTTTITFDSLMNTTTTTDGKGNVVSTQVYSDPNDPNAPSSVSDGNLNQTSNTWDRYGNLLTTTSPRHVTTTNTWIYTQFSLGELTQTQEGTKEQTAFTYYEPSGLLKTLTPPKPGSTGVANPVPTTYYYDTLGNPTSVTTPGNSATVVGGVDQGITTTFGYTSDPTYSYTQTEALGQPITVTNNLGKITHLRYDARGNTVTILDALGLETDTVYNLADQVTQVTAPATGQPGPNRAYSLNTYLYTGGPLSYATAYDETGTQIRQVSYGYGPEGELLSVTGATEPVSYSYDALYRKLTLKDGNNDVTRYYYNQAGYLDSITYPGYSGLTPAFNTTNGTWDNIAGADSVRDAAYDLDGNVTKRLDGRAVETDYSYTDPESQLTDIQYPASTSLNVHYNYDTYGRVSGTPNTSAAMTDATGSTAVAYDDLDNATSVRTTYTGLSAQALTYAFNNDGSRKTLTGLGSTFNYTYDKIGRLVTLLNPFSETSSWTWKDNDWLGQQTLGNNVSSVYTDNARGFLTDLTTKTSTSSLISEFGSTTDSTKWLTYDGVGNRTRQYASQSGAPSGYDGTTSYTYDGRDQLLAETGVHTNSFVYDGGTYSATTGVGNPSTFRSVSGNTFNIDNQITNSGWGYDGNGNPTTYNGSALTFDAENRLTKIGTTLTCGYRADGLRAWKGDGSGSNKTYFLYDGSEPLCELSSSGTILATNTFGAAGLLSRHTSSGSVFYVFDPQGNVAETLSSTVLLASYTFDSFGVGSSSPSSATRFGFGGEAGYYTDTETGFLLLGHRFYDPGTGRFVNRDPIGYGGGVNLYGYVGNDPINDTDPNGTFRHFSAGTIGGFLEDIGIGISEAGAAGLRVATGTIGIGVSLFLNAAPAGPANGNEFKPGQEPWINNGTRKSDAEKKNDTPSWVPKAQVPPPDGTGPRRKRESCEKYARRLLNAKYGVGNWKEGANSEYSKIVKNCREQPHKYPQCDSN